MSKKKAIEPFVLDSQQAADYINISKRKLDELCATGELVPMRIGRKRLFTKEQLEDLLRRAATEGVG